MAQLNARLYDIGNYPGARLSKGKTVFTIGEVYEANEGVWQNLLLKLDEYEGYNAGDKKNCEYVRQVVSAKLSGKRIACWAYLYNLPIHGKKLISSGNYVTYVADQKPV